MDCVQSYLGPRRHGHLTRREASLVGALPPCGVLQLLAPRWAQQSAWACPMPGMLHHPIAGRHRLSVLFLGVGACFIPCIKAGHKTWCSSYCRVVPASHPQGGIVCRCSSCVGGCWTLAVWEASVVLFLGQECCSTSSAGRHRSAVLFLGVGGLYQPVPWEAWPGLFLG